MIHILLDRRRAQPRRSRRLVRALARDHERARGGVGRRAARRGAHEAGARRRRHRDEGDPGQPQARLRDADRQARPRRRAGPARRRRLRRRRRRPPADRRRARRLPARRRVGAERHAVLRVGGAGGQAGRYAGAVVLGHQVTNQLAQTLVKSLDVDMGFHLGADGIAGSKTIAFDHGAMQAAIGKLGDDLTTRLPAGPADRRPRRRRGLHRDRRAAARRGRGAARRTTR